MLRNTVQAPKQFYVKGKIIFGILFLIIISLFTIYVSINVGPYEISKRETFNFFLNYLGFKNHLISDTQIAIIQTVRLPRILMAFVVGGGLSVSGVIMQALFRNNLADPSIIGVSAGGATGAVFAIFTGIAVLSVWAIPFFAFLGSFIALFLVFGISSFAGRISVPTLILSGIAIGAFLNSITSAIILFSGDIESQRQMIFWLAGGFDSARWSGLKIIAPLVIIPSIISLIFARDLNILMIGEDQAESLGIRVQFTRNFLLIIASIITSISVAYTGVIAFVGLIIPHIVRLVVGADNRILIPFTFFTGSIFVLFSDTLARTIISPAEIRVGLITSLLGAPFFIYLLITNRKNFYSL